jgi:hypothetical protein
MRRTAVRWSVLALAVVVAAGCCYWAATLEREALLRRRSLATAVSDGRAAQLALADARRALSAMASPGQAAMSWSRQATTSIEAARGRLAALGSSEGGAELRPLNERFDRLVDAERRVRENAVGGRSLMASDVAFGEALPHVDAVDAKVADVVASMSTTADRAIAAVRDRQLLAAAGALATLGMVAVLLTPLPKAGDGATDMAGAADGASSATEANTTEGKAPVDSGLSLRADADTTPRLPATAPWASGTHGSTAAVATNPSAAEALDFAPLAAACDALARLTDADALPGALEAARLALGARGVVVWLANAERTALSVVASAGYDRRIVERFASTHVNDSNPTSRAFASGTPSSTLAGAGQPAALAVPIGGARGRTGVLSAELLGGITADAQVVARARIVAAQLATLLEPTAAVVDEPAGDVRAVGAEQA